MHTPRGNGDWINDCIPAILVEACIPRPQLLALEVLVIDSALLPISPRHLGTQPEEENTLHIILSLSLPKIKAIICRTFPLSVADYRCSSHKETLCKFEG